MRGWFGAHPFRYVPVGSLASGGTEHNMNTGVALAAHATPISGGGQAQAFGSASAYGLALVTAAVLLALFVMKSPEPLKVRWRPADLWRRAVRLSQACGQWARPGMSRFRRRIDLLLVQMLEQRQFRPSGRQAAKPQLGAEPKPKPDPAPTGGAYQSKHRLVGPPKEPQNPEPQTPRPAPRHAAPPAG